MSGWCENILSVTGPAEELRKFREFINPLSAEKSLPASRELKRIPVSEEEQKAILEKFGASYIEECACKMCGTKLDKSYCEVEESSDMVVYSLPTLCYPPIPAIEKMAEMYRNLSFLLDYGNAEGEWHGAILLIEGTYVASKKFGYKLDKYYDLPFCKEFKNSLAEHFPNMFIYSKRVANG